MNASAGFGLRHALDAMNARFVTHFRINVVALDHRERFLDAADACVGSVHDLHFPALTLGIARIHSQDLGRKKRRLVAAGSGPDLENYVLLVVRVFRQQQEFQSFFGVRQFCFDLGDFGQGHLAHLLVVGRIEQVLVHPARSSCIFLTSRYFSTISPSERCCFISLAYADISDMISGDEICSVSSS